MTPITKSIFLNARICMTRGWLMRAGVDSSPPSEGELFRMEQGQEIGRLARELHPHGVFIKPGTTADAVRRTQNALNDPSVTVLFEAAFSDDDYVARADILKRSKRGWDVFEVKMNLEDTDGLSDLIDDLAYTIMVMRRCSVTVTRAALMLLSRQLRKGMTAADTFVVIDQTKEVEQRLKDYAPLWGPVRAGTSSPKPPIGKLIADCRDCEFFCTHCLGKRVQNSVFNLPNLHKNKVAQLGAAGVVAIESLPRGFQLTDLQQRVVNCIRTRKAFVGPSFCKELSRVEWPAHYLDFESVMTALPLYDDIGPFEQIVTQYSIHHCSVAGKATGHSEYLADPSRDCQRELAENLLRDVGNKGSVIVYSNFEAVRIDALADRFPDLASRLGRLKKRLFDLLPIIRNGFYHHDLGGSFSIKALLPAVIPEMSYDGLEIGDGGTAIARFARMVMSQFSVRQAQQVRVDLLQYCKQDTLAMVRLHEALLGRPA